MPRRKMHQEQSIDDNVILALPPVRTVHPHEHKVDPYQLPPGAVPGKFTVEVKTTPKKGTAKDLAERDALREENRIRARRYNHYLEIMSDTNGNRVEALATVYRVSIDEAKDRLDELHADVQTGRGHTEIARILEQNDLDANARVRILRNHAYSPIPAASLSALKIINEISDDTDSAGSFEQWVRSAKAQK